MQRMLLAASVFCLLTGTARALPLSPTQQSPGEQCRAAIAAAERGHGIPAQLMSAIGRVESGRRDPVTGAWGAWPWTINAAGQGSYFETKGEAIKAVEALQARGVRSIDVGCMQVNLMHHPTAFASLDMAFEPAVNADYAAKFLTQLNAQTGDWTKATANYHSANPAEGGPYAEKVISIWPEEQRKAGMAPPPVLAVAAPAMPFARFMPPNSIRPPPRILGMGGMPPASGALATRGAIFSGMAQAAPVTESPGAIPAAGQGLAQPGLAVGRSLASYRAAPIGVFMPPRMAVRIPPNAIR
jgi:hypothetical protein